VIGMDNLSTGDLANIQHLTGRDFVFVRHDVTNFIAIDGSLDYIFHFASPASPIDYLKLPIQTLKVGSLGTHNCLGSPRPRARGSCSPPPRRSTATRWCTHSASVLGQRQPHRATRSLRRGQALRRSDHHGLPPAHGVQTRIVRIFNTYGPRMRLEDGRAIPAFLSQALRGEDVTVFGDGSQTRSLCYVSRPRGRPLPPDDVDTSDP